MDELCETKTVSRREEADGKENQVDENGQAAPCKSSLSSLYNSHFMFLAGPFLPCLV